ncbi:MAG TPA: PHB depolymerase family esterase [Chryseosolibacter sp.]|nr:PHB depolymerase family esterase [Chryseosolibacter sp.]
MRRILLIAFILCSETSFGQQIFKTTSPSTIAYLEYLPSEYHSNSDKYPIVFFLHGNGEKGANSTDTTVLKQYINLVTKHGPPKHVKSGTEFPFILISPQLKTGIGSWTSSYVMEVINHCKKYLRIDEQRIYLTGLSLGGGGTWVTAQDYPALFAAIAPVCGGYNSPAKACNIASENLPVWAFHGDKDSVVPLSRSQNMVNAVNACTPKPDPLALMTIYTGVGHNAWDYAYRADNSLHNPNVYEWILNYRNTVNDGNYLPVANAGSDKNTSSDKIQLTGTGTDKDGVVNTFSWTKIEGPSATMTNANTSTVSLSNLINGKYVFRLQVTDDAGNTDTDYVTISVSGSTPPTVNAGADKLVRLPSTSTTITASASDDGTVVSYQWTKVSGAACVMSNTTSPTLKLSGLSSGSYTFRLQVKDNDGNIGSDDVNVIVDAPPVANAGLDQDIVLPLTNNLVLSGSGTDTDGTIVKYLWSKYSGPNISMTYTTTKDVVITRLYEGTYVLKLTVTDNLGVTSFDYVTINAKTSSIESAVQSPRVNAGADKLVKLPTTTATLSGSASVDGGSIIAYSWSKISGPSCTLKNVSTSTLKLSGLSSGSYAFRLSVKDSNGTHAYDDITVIVDAPPVVNAGADRSVTLPIQSDIVIQATAADPDGKIVKYLWSKYSGPGAIISNTTTSSLTINELAAGTYVFKLAVTDNLNVTGIDYVTINVIDPAVDVLSSANSIFEMDDLNEQLYDDLRAREVTIAIYDDSGQEVFRGEWSSQIARDVLAETGLYFYKIFHANGKVRTGKIYKRGY